MANSVTLIRWTRVEAWDDVDDVPLRGTVVREADKEGSGMLVMWDSEEYDSGSLGHEVPADMVCELKAIGGRVPVLHRFHPRVGVFNEH